jgi:hypothetical protein
LAPQPAPGSFVVQLSGPPGHSYALQTSTNLKAWTTVSTIVLPGPSINITNELRPSARQQFWRAVPAQ